MTSQSHKGGTDFQRGVLVQHFISSYTVSQTLNLRLQRRLAA